MKSHTEYFTFKTQKRRELVRITDRVQGAVAKSGIQDGMVLVSAMHITAGVFVNDDEPGLWEDIWEWLAHLCPEREDYRHHRTGEDNGDAHLKSLLVHHQVIVPITAGALDLGPWQQVFYAEFDGQRSKRLIVKVMGAWVLRSNRESRWPEPSEFAERGPWLRPSSNKQQEYETQRRSAEVSH